MVYSTFDLDIEPETIIEVGTHYGTEAIALKNKYKSSRVITYEADTMKHQRIEDNFKRNNADIEFRKIGLGNEESIKTFYKFTGYENDGADSLFPRYNGDMKASHKVKITTLKDEMISLNVEKIDLLCMDTQGSELNILKGLGDLLSQVSYIIMEIPSVKMDTSYFKIPENKDSVYDGAGSSHEIISYLKQFGFYEAERRKENDLEDNVLFSRIKPLKPCFDCVLTAVNNNPIYLGFVPDFIKTWTHLFPKIDIKIIFINDEMIPELEPYKQYITLFKPIQNMKTAYIAQNIRLYYPALLKKQGVLVTDIDIYPMNRVYYESPTLNDTLKNTFISYRPKGCVGADQIAMCYNMASSSIWSKVTGVKSIDDIVKCLIEHYPDNYGELMPPPLNWLRYGWFTDQEVLFKLVDKSNINVKYVGDNQFKRIDKLNQTIEKVTKVIPSIKSGQYSDFIPLRPEQKDCKEINNLIVSSLLKK